MNVRQLRLRVGLAAPVVAFGLSQPLVHPATQSPGGQVGISMTSIFIGVVVGLAIASRDVVLAPLSRWWARVLVGVALLLSAMGIVLMARGQVLLGLLPFAVCLLGGAILLFADRMKRSLESGRGLWERQ